MKEILEAFQNVVSKIISDIQNIAKEMLKWLKENYDEILRIHEINSRRNKWFRHQLIHALNAHKKGHSLYLSNQVINRKPKRCVARANL